MNTLLGKQTLRFLLCWLIQILLLKYMNWGWGGEVYLQFFFYPLFIMLLPFRTPRFLVVVLGFVLGISVDFMYDTLGLHAGALVFTAFLRDLVFRIIKPREGYSLTDHPTKHGMKDNWFFRYAGWMLFFHLFFYYSLEAFTYYYWYSIILKIVFSWVSSMAFILMWTYIFNPKE